MKESNETLPLQEMITAATERGQADVV